MEILLRTVLSFFGILIMTRILGKKQIGQLTYFNYVTGISFGALAAGVAIDKNIPILDGLASLLIWTLLTLLIAYGTIKSVRFRKLMEGDPIVVIKRGKIMEKALARARVNIGDLEEMLRERDIFSISDVDYAVFETNGYLSVVKKPDKQGVTLSDMKLKATPQQLPTKVIADGRIIMRSLKEIGLNREWLDKELSKAGYKEKDIPDIFYAGVMQDGTLYIDRKDDGLA